MKSPRLHGVLVTFRRPRELAWTLAQLARQERRLDSLTVVDNEPTIDTEDLVRASDGASVVRYLAMGDNVGFAGGLAAGAERILAEADDDDWLIVLDDDDPPFAESAFARLLEFAQTMIGRDPRTAGVGYKGARFDRRRAVMVRLTTSTLPEAPAVDYIAGNGLPLYRVGALREVGTFTPELFFSHEELDLGLRLTRAGYALYLDGVLLRERRIANARPDVKPTQRWRIVPPNWRAYYSFRNTIYILRKNGWSRTAARISVARGLGKPLLHMPFEPVTAMRALKQNTKAIRDAWTGRLGRTVQPLVAIPRPGKLAPAIPPE